MEAKEFIKDKNIRNGNVSVGFTHNECAELMETYSEYHQSRLKPVINVTIGKLLQFYSESTAYNQYTPLDKILTDYQNRKL